MTVTRGKGKVTLLRFPVYVAQTDIDTGECRLANSCMVRVATERKLRQLEPARPNHHTRVDAGHIRFTFEGYRYAADTPRTAAKALKDYDREEVDKRKAKRAGVPFKSKVEPFSFNVVAVRKSKLKPSTETRKEQINTARKRRQAEGQVPKRYTLHKRVVGFA